MHIKYKNALINAVKAASVCITATIRVTGEFTNGPEWARALQMKWARKTAMCIIDEPNIWTRPGTARMINIQLWYKDDQVYNKNAFRRRGDIYKTEYDNFLGDCNAVGERFGLRLI